MENKLQDNDKFISGVWSEKILVVTQDYEIRGYVFMPKTGKKNRLLSDILNGTKRFVAIKDCEVIHRNNPARKAEHLSFIQLNLNSIILLRPEETQSTKSEVKSKTGTRKTKQTKE